MPYSKISSTAALKLAALLSFTLLLVANAAFADVMQDCGRKEKTLEDVHSCVVATEQRSIRELRERGNVIAKKLRSADDKAGFRSYVAGESNLIRERKKICEMAEKVAVNAKTDAELARLSCQADVNFAHLVDLAKRYPE